MLGRYAVAAILAGLTLGGGVVPPASAQDTIRIGIIAQLSGPYANAGEKFKQGIETYIALHGSSAGGRTVEVIYRDVGGSNPAVAKRLAEEMIVKDKVALLGGFYLTPEASAVASVATETKTPAVIFMAASPPVVRQSPYFVRVSQSLWQSVVPSAEWAIKTGRKNAYIAVADFAPGYDVEEAFKKTFTGLGGKVTGDDRIPLNTVDFSAFAARIHDAKPDVLNIFMPNGAPSVGFIKALAAQGVISQGTAVIGQGGEADDAELHLFDDSVIGVYQTIYYAISVDNDENRRFKETLKAKFGPDVVPNYTIVSAYDGMHLLYKMIDSQKGKPFDGTAAVDAVRGYSWESPRGMVKIEADTRDITQPEYVRRVENVDGRLQSVVVDTYPAVKDPWAALHP